MKMVLSVWHDRSNAGSCHGFSRNAFTSKHRPPLFFIEMVAAPLGFGQKFGLGISSENRGIWRQDALRRAFLRKQRDAGVLAYFPSKTEGFVRA